MPEMDPSDTRVKGDENKRILIELWLNLRCSKIYKREYDSRTNKL